MTKQSISKQKIMDCHEAKASRNDGFTLAEVLITLVIIGIIAAITVPSLIKNKTNEELRAGLFKAQSTLAGALEMYYAKNGERILPSESVGFDLKNKLMPFISTAKDCGLNTCIPTNSTVYRTYNNSQTLYNQEFDEGQFIMNDNMLVLIQNSASSSSWLQISVDVNGYKKKPNRAGHDLFVFRINEKGILVPVGTKGTIYTNPDLYCSDTSTEVKNGFGCTAKALSDPNYFKNLH